jgi:hypothetical protein
MLWYTRAAQSCNKHKNDVVDERRFCSIVMPGRAEGMERHVAVDCAAVDPQAKTEMSQHLYNKKMQTLERKGVKRRAGGEGAPSAEPSGPMLEPPPPMAPQIISHAHMPPYSGAACCTPMTVKSSWPLSDRGTAGSASGKHASLCCSMACFAKTCSTFFLMLQMD